MIIHLDMDGVITDFYSGFINSLQARKIKYKGALDWNLTSCIDENISKTEKQRIVHRIMCHSAFWRTLEPISGAIDSINILLKDKRHTLFITTSPYMSYPGSVSDKISWVRDFIPNFPINNMNFLVNKWLVRGDVLVDDKPKNIYQWKGKHAICFRQPWNEEVTVKTDKYSYIWKVADWNSLLDLLETINPTKQALSNCTDF